MIFLVTNEARQTLASLLDGCERPKTIERSTWAAIKRAEVDQLSFQMFGQLCDLYPSLMGQLTDEVGDDVILVPDGGDHPREAAAMAHAHAMKGAGQCL